MNFIDILITITINLLVVGLYHILTNVADPLDDCCGLVDDKATKQVNTVLELLTKNDKLILDQQVDIFKYIKNLNDATTDLKKDIEVLQKSDTQTNDLIIKSSKDTSPQEIFRSLIEYYRKQTGKNMFSKKEYDALMGVITTSGAPDATNLTVAESVLTPEFAQKVDDIAK